MRHAACGRGRAPRAPTRRAVGRLSCSKGPDGPLRKREESARPQVSWLAAAGGRVGWQRRALPAGPEEPPQPASHPAGARLSYPRVRRARLSAAAFGARVARDYGRKAAGVVGGVLCLVRPDGGAPGCRAGRSTRMGACSISGGSGPAAGCSARSVQQASPLTHCPVQQVRVLGTEPGGKHASIGPSKPNDRHPRVSHALLQVPDQCGVVSHRLRYRVQGQAVQGQRYRVRW